MSASATAASTLGATRASTPSRSVASAPNRAAAASSMSNAVTCDRSNNSASSHRWVRPSLPQPTMARRLLSGRAKNLAPTAAWPPVRMFVTEVPSTSASGMPVSVSVTKSSAEMAGRDRRGFLDQLLNHFSAARSRGRMSAGKACTTP